MTLLAPTALWWLLVAAPILGLFLYQRRVVEVVVPAITFWEPRLTRRRFGAFGRRARRWLSLLVHLGIVILLATALTHPSLLGPVEHLTIVLDDSATMQTREEGGHTRFELAVTELQRRVYAKPDGVRVSLIVAGNPPRVLLRGATDPALILESARRVRPRDVGPAIDDALALTRRVTTADPATTLLISDQGRHTFDQTLVEEYVQVGSDRPNVGITDVTLAVDENAVDVFLAQRRRTGASVEVQLIANGQPIAGEKGELQENSTVLRLRPPSLAGQPFEIVVAPPDDFDLDNRFYGVWPAEQESRVQLVSAGTGSLVAALDQPDISLDLVGSGDWSSTHADVTILDAAPGGPGRPVAGRFVVMGGIDPFGVVRTVPVARDLTPSQWAPRSPFLKDVDLMSWHVRRTAGFGAPFGSQVLVQSGETPLLFLVKRKLGSNTPREQFVALYVDFAVGDSNLERRASLAILLWNAIEALQGRQSGDVAISHVTGAPVSLPATPGMVPRIRTPSGDWATVYRDGDRLVLPFPERAGFYEMRTPTEVVLQAVNYLGHRHLSHLDTTASVRAGAASGMAAEWFSLPLWARAVVLVLVAAAAELFAFHLRVLRID